MTTVRYGDVLRRAGARRLSVDFSAVTRWRRDGAPRLASTAAAPRRRILHLRRLLLPYLGGLSWDQLRAVVPLALYLVVFQALILRTGVQDPLTILGGLGAVVIGLMLFMEGLRVGLMPFGEAIGHKLPERLPLAAVLGVAFALGVGVTYAEPAIGALKQAGALVRPETAPVLYALLNGYSEWLVVCVGLGVGAAALLGILRALQGWSLKPFIFLSLAGTLGLSAFAATIPALEPVLALAWDCGAVTTGPVTVPLVLALGIGVSGAAGRESDGLAGFGIVTLASLFPVAAVLLLAIGVATLADPVALLAGEATATPGWWQISPWAEVIGGLRAIVPLVLFLGVVAKVLAKAELEEKTLTVFGLALAVLGMIVFSLGLTYGLSALGAQAGGLVPAAFAPVDGVAEAPLYGWTAGLALALGFAAVLGFGATLAEPALNTLGATVETLTNGAFKRSALVLAVSVGVGVGIALGVAKLVFGLPILWLVLPGYVLAAALTLVSSETFVNVAWDSAGVTTGPVTVPLVLALGLGFGDALGATEGFGILAMASVGPIVSVLSVGLWVRLTLARQARAAEAPPPAPLLTPETA